MNINAADEPAFQCCERRPHHMKKKTASIAGSRILLLPKAEIGVVCGRLFIKDISLLQEQWLLLSSCGHHK